MAYTYLLKHVPTNRFYYGLRIANVYPPKQDLWQEYFSSCEEIKELITQYGQNSFLYEVRREFKTAEATAAWETKVLRRCKVLHDPKWINANIAGYIVPTARSRAKISAFHKGVPKSEEHKQKIGHANKGKVKGPLSDETKSKISIAKSGSNNPMFGVPYSEERRQKQSAAMKGKPSHQKDKPRTEEQKQKQRDKMTGRKQDPAVVARRAVTQRSLGLKRKRVICCHCSKEIPVNIFARYHGDRCKFKPK